MNTIAHPGRRLNPSQLLLWSFIAMLLSAISTAVFSESPFNDHFAFSMMGIAVIGMLISAAFLTVDAVWSVCNP